MRLLSLFLALFALAAVLPSRAADLPLVDGDRIVSIGDSLSFHIPYPDPPTYIYAYLARRNPTLQLHLHTLAKSGAAIETFLAPPDSALDVTYQFYPKWVSPLINSGSPTHKYVASEWADNNQESKATYKNNASLLMTNWVVGVDGAVPIFVGMTPQSTPDGYSKGGLYDDANQELVTAAASNWWTTPTWQNLSGTFTSSGAKVFTSDSTTDFFTASGHGYSNGDRVTVSLSGSPAGPTASPVLDRNHYYYIVNKTTNTYQLATTLGGSPIDILTNGSGTNYISVHWPRWIDDLSNTGTYGVHPSCAASEATAWKVITGLGWGTDVSTATVAANTLTVTATDHCSIGTPTTNGYGGIDFTRLDTRLPWAVDESFAGTGRLDAVASYPAMANWQAYMLTVTGLTSGTYDVIINGTTVAAVPDTTFATGWNMADLTSGPVWTAGQLVLQRLREVQGINPTDLTEVTSPARTGVNQYKSTANNSYETLGNRTTAHASACASQISAINTLDVAVKAAAQPMTLTISLHLQGYVAPAFGARRVGAGRRLPIR